MLNLFPQQPEDQEDERRIDVTHPETGLPALMEDRCTTCVFRPGNLMNLQPGRLQQMVRGALADDTWIVCHSTLDEHPASNGHQAICRGFYDTYGQDSAGIRLARFFGGPTPLTHHHAGGQP